MPHNKQDDASPFPNFIKPPNAAAIIALRCRHHRATIQPSAGNGSGSSKSGIVRLLGCARDERIFHSFDQAHGIKPPFIWQSQEKNITLQNKQEGNIKYVISTKDILFHHNFYESNP